MSNLFLVFFPFFFPLELNNCYSCSVIFPSFLSPSLCLPITHIWGEERFQVGRWTDGASVPWRTIFFSLFVSGLRELLLISDGADNLSRLNCCFDFTELKSKPSASMAECFDWSLTLHREKKKKGAGRKIKSRSAVSRILKKSVM